MLRNPLFRDLSDDASKMSITVPQTRVHFSGIERTKNKFNHMKIINSSVQQFKETGPKLKQHYACATYIYHIVCGRLRLRRLELRPPPGYLTVRQTKNRPTHRTTKTKQHSPTHYPPTAQIKTHQSRIYKYLYIDSEKGEPKYDIESDNRPWSCRP